MLKIDHYDEKEKSEIKIKYKKTDIAKIHQELVAKGEIKANAKLSGLKEEEIPFVNIHTSLRKVDFFNLKTLFI